ncbi:MAG: hypothetical protein WCJ29_01065 [bacterium]
MRPTIRDYSESNFERGTVKDNKFKTRLIISAVIVVIFMIGFSILLIKSPWFFVREVKISGLKFLSEDPVIKTVNDVLDEKLYGIIPKRHRLFVDTEEIKSKLLKDYAFSTAKVGESGGIVQVEISERPTGVLVTDGKNPIFTDLQGIMVRTASEDEKILIGKSDVSLPFLVIFAETALDNKPGDKIFSETFLSSYENLKLHFEVETGLVVQAYELPRANASWIKIRLADKREVYVDTARTIDSQIKKLLALMKTKGETLDAVSYIDLRFPDRVYYK